MVEIVFVVVVAVLVVAAVAILIIQSRVHIRETVEPPPPVGFVGRSGPALLQLVCFTVVAVGAAKEGREIGTIVASIGALAAVAQIIYYYRRRESLGHG